MFAAHRRERRLDARVIDVGVPQHVLGIGAPDDRQFLLFRCVEEQDRVRCDLLGGGRHMLSFLAQCARRAETRTQPAFLSF